MKFSIWDFSSKCDQIRRKLRIWSHLLEKSLMETFIFVQCNYVFTTIPIMLFENIILTFFLNNRPLPLREKCWYSEFFFSVFSRIQTVYGSARLRENATRMRENRGQKHSKYGHFIRSVRLQAFIKRTADDDYRRWESLHHFIYFKNWVMHVNCIYL